VSNTSCRRLTLAATAILAGAVIPIIATASAWADGLTETEDFGQLVGQGLNYYEAYEVVQAESSGLPVEVSYDGQVVVEANEPTDPLLGAFAESGTGTDVAAAIATNSPAIENQTIADSLLGSNNVAFADGGGSYALAGDEVPTSVSNNDTATAIGTYSFAYATAGSNDNGTDIGSNSFAVATGNYDTVYDVGSGVGNGANDVTAGGDDDFVIGLGNGLPNTDVVNTGVFDIVTPQSGESGAASAAADTTDPVVPVDGGASAVLNGDTIVLNPYPSEIITTITNSLDTQVISDQGFVLDPPGVSGPYDGEYFQGTVNDTTFSFGPTDQYIDVTFSDARLPPDPGSIINVLNYGGGFENAYADIVGSAPADEIITPFGDFAVPTGIVEFLGPDFFIPSVETMTSSAASAIDPSLLTDALDPSSWLGLF
jgi:hypothetical protein